MGHVRTAVASRTAEAIHQFNSDGDWNHLAPHPRCRSVEHQPRRRNRTLVPRLGGLAHELELHVKWKLEVQKIPQTADRKAI